MNSGDAPPGPRICIPCGGTGRVGLCGWLVCKPHGYAVKGKQIQRAAFRVTSDRTPCPKCAGSGSRQLPQKEVDVQ